MVFNKIRINIGLCALLMLLPAISFSQNELEKTWLWQISGGELEGRSFILGTMPSQDSTFYQFNNRVWKAMDKTDVFLSFDNNLPPSYKKFHEVTLGTFDKHYEPLPSAYLKSLAEQDLKPTIYLDATNSFHQLYANGDTAESPKKASVALKKSLRDHYLGADLTQFIELRQKLDVPASVYKRLTERTNYQIINELIDKMRLQPCFVAIDGVYLPGDEGLLNLLKARGYQVRPVGVKDYEKVAAQIAYRDQMLAQAQAPVATPTQPTISQPTEPTSSVITAPTNRTEYVKLDLPMGVLNLSQWSDYTTDEDKYSYSAPQKLKAAKQPGRFKTTHGGLTYQFDVVEKWDNLSKAIERLIIKNGGQLVAESTFKNQAVTGKLVELMYAENQISKHAMLHGINNNVIVTVKGETPQIHSVLADRFLQSFAMEQLPPETPNANGLGGLNIPNIFKPNSNPQEPTQPVAPMWSVEKLNGLQFSFPIKHEEQVSKTADGKQVKAFISSKVVDKNTFVIVASNKETFDNFKLFNTAINTATTEIQGIVVDRNVMPEGRTNFAEYLLKDAVDNFYRVRYLYKDNTLYQIIIKGDKKSVYNANAERVLQSIILP